MRYLFFVTSLIFLAACSEPTLIDLTPTAESARQTLQPDSPEMLCASVERGWNTDWALVIAALETLIELGHDCHAQPSEGKLYAAHVNYGAQLESSHQEDAAITQYQAALLIRRDGVEAIEALENLNAPLPEPPPLEICSDEQIQQATLAPHVPSQGEFVQIQGQKFVLAGDVMPLRGVNYFPARFPWRRFLTESDHATLESELTLLHETGLNTLRIFLWYEGLFQCPGNGAIPDPQGFARLDSLIKFAADLDFRLIVTLHDLPDLTWYPLYSNPTHIQQQTAFIVERYRDEPTILAWDIRNEGDIDYTRHRQNRDEVLAWAEATTTLIHQLDKNHLLTAGWLNDEMATIAFVDFVSFHYWSAPDNLVNRIENIREATDKPIVLEEFGYSTFRMSETDQAERLFDAIQIAEREGLAGWLIWAAFDFPTDVTCIPPACPDVENQEHHFGIWRSDYTPKPAVEMIGQG